MMAVGLGNAPRGARIPPPRRAALSQGDGAAGVVEQNVGPVFGLGAWGFSHLTVGSWDDASALTIVP